MQRNNGLEFPKFVNFSQSLVTSSATFHTETALLHNSETYMRIPPLCFLTCPPTLQGLATAKCWYPGMTGSCWSGKWCVSVSAKISTLESSSYKVGEVRSFVHAPPWIFQQQKLTTLWPSPPYVEGLTGRPSTKSSPPFHRGRLPTLRTSRNWGCSTLHCCCYNRVRSSSRPQVVPASLALALKTALQASTVLNFSSSRVGRGVATTA